ncbi:hypothetical protein BHE74_00054870 [Ensete ventricosum]|nr:hypothetical protein BHE74_00054870 [Ensete ventricosum]
MFSALPRTTGCRLPIARRSTGDSSLGSSIWLDCSDPSRWEREIRGRKAIAVVPPVGRGCGSVTRRAVLAWDMGAEEEVGYSRCFLRAQNAEDFEVFEVLPPQDSFVDHFSTLVVTSKLVRITPAFD